MLSCTTKWTVDNMRSEVRIKVKHLVKKFLQ